MRENMIRVAAGDRPADLVLRNAQVFNVFTGEFLLGDVAVADGFIAGVGHYPQGKQVVDLEGRYLVPGFINAHCHVESSMVTPAVYCREELRWGVTTLITDPHEIANVAGIEGIRYMLDAGALLPINQYIQLPSCVPSTPFEHAGAILDAAALEPLLSDPAVLGLGEMMNYPGVLDCDPTVMAKLDMAAGRIIDGHAPDLTGRQLQAYVAAGIKTDHESVTFDEALEKLRAGMYVLVREGSASRNLEAILTGVVANNIDTRCMAFCTDDKHIAAIHREGTVSHCIRKAVALGLDVIAAYRMATINAANIFGLRQLGAVAPGYRADLLVLDNLETVAVHRLYKDGKEVALQDWKPSATPQGRGSVRIAPIEEASFALPQGEAEYPVIGIQKGQITTQKHLIAGDQVESMLASGTVCKVAVIERHRASGSMGVGLLAGYGLRQGAIASTVAHDSHNLIVAGCNDSDMLFAAREVQRIQGGYVLVRDGAVVGAVPLPVYGLMSDGEPEEFIRNLHDLIDKAHASGIDPDVDPFITLSFLALPVLPEIRITDMGVFDVQKFSFGSF